MRESGGRPGEASHHEGGAGPPLPRPGRGRTLAAMTAPPDRTPTLTLIRAARDGDRQASDPRRPQQAAPHLTGSVDPLRARLVGAEAHQVERAARARQRDPAGKTAENHQRQQPVAAGLEVAHHPAHHAGGLCVVGEVLQQQHAGADGVVQADAGQQQDRRRQVPAPRGQRQHHRRGGQRADQRRRRHGHLCQQRRGAPAHRDRRGEGRAGGHAEGVGGRQWIAEKRLEGRTGKREAAADDCREQHPWQPCDEQNRGVDVAAPVERVGESAHQVDACRTHERPDDEGGGERHQCPAHERRSSATRQRPRWPASTHGDSPDCIAAASAKQRVS